MNRKKAGSMAEQSLCKQRSTYRLKIERLPKTAAGEVTVYFEDGKRAAKKFYTIY